MNYRNTPYLLIAATVACMATDLSAQLAIGTGAIADVYRQHCAICHGRQLQGGLGGSLIIQQLKHGSDDDSLLRAISDGFPDSGMAGFAAVLDDPTRRALVAYIREVRQQALEQPIEVRADGSIQSRLHEFRMETLVETAGEIWGMAYLPNGELLFTEKQGSLQVLAGDGQVRAILDIPESWQHGQGGMLDVALHPQFAANGWIYLAYSTRRTPRANTGMTVIARGRIVDDRWTDGEVLWEAPESTHSRHTVHFGTRIVFQDGYLFFAIGDRGQPDLAQDLSTPQGAVHRLYDDGRIPQDNPFVGKENAYASIWSYGHRNPQGLAFHPQSGELWSTEHGPRGGDELNRIIRAANYGWPRVTHGINYNGTPITPHTQLPGMEPPALHWTPSIAVCGIAFYTGGRFPDWRNDLLVTGLASEQLHRIRIRDNQVVEEEILLRGHGRLRDVITAPDGSIVLAINHGGRSGGRSALVRLVD